MMSLRAEGGSALPPPSVVETRRAGHPEGELDRSTLERCKKGDPLAFRAFVVRYERLVFALLSRMLGRGAHVEDLAQETFLRAFRAFERFELTEASRPSTWLLTIATRLAIDERRRRHPELDLDDDDRRISVDFRTPEQEIERMRLGEAIEQAASTLSAEQRAVFLLAELHDCSMAEIGEVIGIGEATVKTRLHRARLRMREALNRFGGQPR